MNTNVKINIKLSGLYRVEKMRHGETVYIGEWIPNLITNNGLDQMATRNDRFDNCYVGSGSTTPAPGDVQLVSQIAESSSISSTSEGIDTNENYRYFRRSYTFNEGVATGNISELGVGYSSTSLFSRALVVDAMGSPTTITILPDEILVVTYELRLYMPLDDFLFSVDGYDVVMRSSDIDNDNVWHSLNARIEGQGGGSFNQAYSGSIGDVNNQPSGALGAVTTVSDDPYVSGSFSRTSVHTYGIGTSNGEINSLTVFWFSGGFYQFSIDPSIVKTSNDELRFTQRLTWGRQGELPS